MGNQLTALAPAQILPMESYFHDLPDFGKPVSLGSTRFMKVARSKYTDGTEVVVKIFPKIDSSVQLQMYEKRLHDINMRLRFIANVLPYQNFWDSDKAAFLVRQHVQYNLYDRISTRPYLNNIEKKWIVFQLLKALEGCHEKKVYHGDLKTENVLLTGWGWVFLTDFASFKPTLLPADNPADYTFFFDTSRRRNCYVAPERFVHASSYSQSSSASDSFQRNKPLTYEMDIFSLGCVTAELFLDGQLIFNLSELLDYCQKEFSPEPLLKKITDKYIKKMVRHMIQFKASDRRRPEQYLTMFKGLVFPEYFYTFLHDYFKSFTTATQLTPDQCIKKLYGDIEAILANLFLNSTKQDRETGYGDVLVIVLSAITSNLRVAQFAGSKLQAIEMMRTIANYVSDCSILERIVPFLHLLIKDKWPSVRAEAIRTLSFCLSVIRKVPRSDFNLFPEYILPVILMVPKDIDVQVRVALAESVAELALSSHRFLELAQLQMNQEAAGDEPSGVQYQIYGTYDNELHQLHETFQSIVVHLLSDNDSNVKRAFLTHSAGKLCTFFGAQKAKEVILSHMITFLNDKSNWELHIAFFEAIVDVVSQIGERSLDTFLRLYCNRV
uniref:non-specific serine/threonine protein kinase n=2 Tax=Amphimedon queenslandica TaxID=400682 RepID=A0A1X7TYI4_AMPQE